jgi:hypothetical protein
LLQNQSYSIGLEAHRLDGLAPPHCFGFDVRSNSSGELPTGSRPAQADALSLPALLSMRTISLLSLMMTSFGAPAVVAKPNQLTAS